jgi:5-methylcytosine-specific restriction endonuclease McrA
MTKLDGKPCTQCGTSEWYLWGNCKQCARNRSKKWRKDNPGKRAESDRKRYYSNPEKYRQDRKKWCRNNPDKVREKGKKWRDENPNYLKNYYQENKSTHYAKAREWIKKNPEKNREYKRKWKRNNPEANIVYKHKRRAKKAKAGGGFTIKEWKQLCEKYDNKCLACGKHKKLTVDHVIPIAKGGHSNISNIQPLCRVCNSKKNARIIDYR